MDKSSKASTKKSTKKSSKAKPAPAPVLPELDDSEKRKQALKNDIRAMMFRVGNLDQMTARFEYNKTKRAEIKAVFEDAEVLDGDVVLKLKYGLQKYEKEATLYMAVFERIAAVLTLGGSLDDVCFEEQNVKHFDDNWVGLCNTNKVNFDYCE